MHVPAEKAFSPRVRCLEQGSGTGGPLEGTGQPLGPRGCWHRESQRRASVKGTGLFTPVACICVSLPSAALYGEGGGVGRADPAVRCRDGGQSRSVDEGHPSPRTRTLLGQPRWACRTCLPKAFLSPQWQGDVVREQGTSTFWGVFTKPFCPFLSEAAKRKRWKPKGKAAPPGR